MDNSRFSEPFNCLVVGVGGQGVVLASRLVAAACMKAGAFVRTAETIGMSQRGGSVASHVRAASDDAALPSSLIETAGADLVLSFEPGEALRVMLLGAAIGLGALPFDSEALLAAMKELMRPNLVPMNEKALELGTKLAIQR